MTLTRDFYNRPTLDVARELLGKRLVHHPANSRRTSGLIVEVEAYIGESDPACHAAPGRTRRNAPLYGPPGIAYVYLNYGMHYLVNAVTEAVDAPAAVLIRALEPSEGIDLMRKRRSRGTIKPAASWDVNELCRGPGNLTKSLAIALDDTGTDLSGPRLFIEDVGVSFADHVQIDDEGEVPAVATRRAGGAAWSPRIGISVGTEHHWRCFVHGHPCVSGGPRWRVVPHVPAPARLRLRHGRVTR